MVIKIWQNFPRLVEMNVFPVFSEALNFKIFWGEPRPNPKCYSVFNGTFSICQIQNHDWCCDLKNNVLCALQIKDARKKCRNMTLTLIYFQNKCDFLNFSKHVLTVNPSSSVWLLWKFTADKTCLLQCTVYVTFYRKTIRYIKFKKVEFDRPGERSPE